jgi:hypothetical protein
VDSDRLGHPHAGHAERRLAERDRTVFRFEAQVEHQHPLPRFE